MRNAFFAVIVVLAVFSAFTTWRWIAAVERETALETAAKQLETTINEQKATLQREIERSALIDKTMLQLTSDRQEILGQLNLVLDIFKQLPRSEGDTDASFACLDLPLPRAAADLMRDPASARGSN